MANILTALMRRTGITLPTITPGPVNMEGTSILRSEAYYWQPFLKDRPISYFDCIMRCNFYYQQSSFLKTLLYLKLSMWHWGFRVKAKDPKDQDKLDKWMEAEQEAGVTDITLEDMGTFEKIELESNTTNAESVLKFARDVMDQFLRFDNVVAHWMDGRNVAQLIDTHRCLYSDNMGIETIRYQHGLSWFQILQLPKEQQERYRNHPMVFLNPAFGDHWKLLKRTLMGRSFGIPSLVPLLRALGEENSKEEGLSMLSWLGRTARRRHRLGHKIDSPSPAIQKSAQWTQKGSEAIEKQYSNSQGPADVTSNFDHEIDFPWLDPKVFDETVFKGSTARILRWAGPIGMALYREGEQPSFLMDAALAEATVDREYVQPFIEMVLKKAYKPPVEIYVEWSDDIFTEARLRQEMLKFTSQLGSTSPQTMLEKAGLDPAKEKARKIAAVNDPDVQKAHLTLYDISHGTTPAIHGVVDPIKEAEENRKAKALKKVGSNKKNGKPKGSKNKT